MFRAFFPEADGADGFGANVEARAMSMAEVQQHLIVNKDSQMCALQFELATETKQSRVA
jgi:phage replication-related protein YjqB (UPF0714/DUF867 family)